MIFATAVIFSIIINFDGVIMMPYSTFSDIQENNAPESYPKKIALRNYVLVTREEWGARPPNELTPLHTPVDYVVIHHSFIPPMCTTRDQCSYAMRTMQSMHMDENHWADVGYNFGIGSDGDMYEGRGWTLRGAHALHFNSVSVGICVIGNWNNTLPPEIQLQAVKELISAGVHLGYISEDYKLIGHRQVRNTECPGQAFYEEIEKWSHFAPGNHITDSVRDDKPADIGVSRDDWGARLPIKTNTLTTPVKYVVIHHSLIPPACSTKDQCMYAMRTMQSMHMDDKNWTDIGYNFAVGGDGEVYEGRGWNTVGAHTIRFNNQSIGICLIGDWSEISPPEKMLEITKKLIANGVENNYIDKEYKLFGHQQIRETECPGKALQKEIESWPNFEASPEVKGLRSDTRSYDVFSQLFDISMP